jgi:hypothetical protein
MWSAPPAAFATQLDDPGPLVLGGAVRAVMRPAGPIEQPVGAFGQEPVAPFADGLGVDLVSVGGGFDGPAVVEDAGHHPFATGRGQHRVGVLGPSVHLEPSVLSRCVVEDPQTHSEGSLIEGPSPHPARDNVPARHN